MKNFKSLVAALLLTCFFGACSDNVGNEIALSREASKQLGAQLKNKLISTMQTAGPEEAITVCNLEAINISSEVSKNNNLKVGRTSLKIRNSNNSPDDWEHKKLLELHHKHQSEEDIDNLEVYEIVKKQKGNEFRYLKAIPVSEPCLLCHGKSIAPIISTKISELYPTDQATGYELGEIRGAFTVKIDL